LSDGLIPVFRHPANPLFQKDFMIFIFHRQPDFAMKTLTASSLFPDDLKMAADLTNPLTKCFVLI